MTLRKVKILYCVSVIALAILLIAAGDTARWIGAILLLIGALPGFKVIGRANALSALRSLNLHRLNGRHSQSTDQASEDQTLIEQ